MTARPEGFATFYWSCHTPSLRYALRDCRHAPLAIITHTNDPQYGAGFHGQVFTCGMPESGPYPTAEAAAEWIIEFMTSRDMVPKDSRFGPLPEVT